MPRSWRPIGGTVASLVLNSGAYRRQSVAPMSFWGELERSPDSKPKSKFEACGRPGAPTPMALMPPSPPVVRAHVCAHVRAQVAADGRNAFGRRSGRAPPSAPLARRTGGQRFGAAQRSCVVAQHGGAAPRSDSRRNCTWCTEFGDGSDSHAADALPQAVKS